MMKLKKQVPIFLLKSTLALTLLLAATSCKKKQETAESTPQDTVKTPVIVTPPTVASTFVIGTNGHPFNAAAYNASSTTVPGVDYATQASMLKAMGMSYYRIDIQTDATGKATSESKLLDLITKCAAQNIKILPMISDKCSYADTATTTGNYQRAYTQMKGFATKYGQYFDYFELGNEWELFDNLLLTPTGQVASNYDLPKVLMAEQYVKGMEAGLKSVLPNKQSIVNTAGYLPTYWMDRMLAAAPTINICGWHLYADMPPNYVSQLGIDNIHTFLYQRYHRPIWYTETGYRYKTTKIPQQNEDASNDWRASLMAQAKADPNVKGIIFYELLDEPERSGFTGANYQEENFGWIKYNNYPGKTDQAAWNAWVANPNRYHDWSYKRPGAELVALQPK